MKFYGNKKGFTLIEVIFTTALLLILFGGIFSTTQIVIKLIGKAKASAGAMALANERMEYIRSLPYSQVGTIGSPPYGSIPQNSTTTLNGITYSERVLVTYIDDPADGLEGLDENSIIDDYKLVKVVYSWNDRGNTESVSLISNIIPVGIETTTGGGTIKVNVFDDAVLPVPGAEVHYVNSTLSTTTDTIRYTNNAGVAFLSGAPEGGDYEITVTKPSFSTDGTYVATVSNPNPATPPVAVVESAVSTMNFQIATTSNLNIETVSIPTTESFTVSLTDATHLTQLSSTTVTAGQLELMEETPSVYYATGSALSATVTPASLQSWSEIVFNGTSSASTSYAVSVYYDTGSGRGLVPDADLPGNSSGFTISPINISTLDTSTYPGLVLGFDLSTVDTNYSPAILDWTVSNIASQSSIGNIDLRLFGQKSIGTDALSQPVLKYDQSLATDGSGSLSVSDLEWDIYDIELLTSGYDIAEACSSVPLSLSPDSTETIALTLDSSVSYALRVLVTEVDGTPIHGADVNLNRGAIDETQMTSTCGQVFFNSALVSATDYTLTVSKSGYTTYVDSAVKIDSSTTTATVILN